MIEQAFLNIAQKLGIHNIKPAEVKEQVKLYLSSERAGKWLLIFDNADDTEMWLTANNTAPALEDFLPQSEQGHIIFTTRNGELAVELTSSNIISIPDVDKETAWNILESLLLNKALLKDHIITATLLEQLAFLPLAIAQASAYINKKRLSLSAYSTLLQEEEQEAVELLSEDFQDPGRYKDIQNPVITTWLISFKQIQRQSQAAADYLSFIGCISPRNIPQSLLPLQTTKKQRLDALGLLNAYSFTSSQGTDISMHRLVHIATRSWLRKKRVFSHWVHKVAGQMDLVFPDNHHNNRGLWREYLPHALALAYENEFIIQQEQYLHLTEKIADCLGSDGRYHEAEVLYNRLMRINQEKNGQEHPSTLTSMGNLASTYRNQGRWNEAEKLEVQVMETRKTVLGAEHPETLTSIANLATTYRNQGRWNEAEKLDRQVMEISKTVLGAEHPETLTSIANLATTYWNQGQWNEAEKLEIQVIEISKRVLGAEHPNTLTSMGNLASTYRNQGRWNEAEKLEVQVMETRKTVLGAEHPETLTSIANLATTYRNQGRWNEAEKLDRQVMEIRKTVLGADHPETLTSIANLATTYWNQGQWNEAEKLEIQVQVIEISKTVLGADHPSTLTSMANLAYAWESQGKLHDAMALMENCSELRSKVLGPNHPDARASSHTLSHWKHEHISNRTPGPAPSQIECSQYVPEISTGNAETTIATQLSHQEYVKPLPPQRQSANPFLRGQFLSHPLIILSRANSPASGHQHLQEVD
ncbi:hypothetical protein ETB97_005675 [Aspergillus alliaceus]|uniref:Kinesin light chain n=1 Tax=Petromyces alliaceus TaxID=209559 RepID=A0A8H6E2W6_PETAA|nr:hypothetical protein ETB97_005675 [Aspergillus burnettii]